MRDYATQLKDHLAGYKRNSLHVEEDGVWHKTERPYAHILPYGVRDLNLIEQIRGRCIEYITQNGVKRHRDFSHLNSSQAFALNLFFPFLGMTSSNPTALLQALGFEDNVLKCWDFEFKGAKGEGTNFDLHLELVDGHEVFIEVKLTETEFGGGKSNPERRTKRKDVYLPRLRGKVKESVLSEIEFFQHYQLLRNVSYCEAGRKTLLLVFPRANDRVRESAIDFIRQHVEPALSRNVRIVYVEDLVTKLSKHSDLSPELLAALSTVRSKYNLVEPAEGTVAIV